MRTIKFRAWDKGNKVMHHNVQFIKSGDEGNDWICFTSDEAHYEKNRKEGIVLNNPYFSQQIELMQFTNLTDKSGKEIWEGDILGRDNFSDWVVIWGKERFEIYNVTDPSRTYPLEQTFDREVIGNIWDGQK